MTTKNNCRNSNSGNCSCAVIFGSHSPAHPAPGSVHALKKVWFVNVSNSALGHEISKRVWHVSESCCWLFFKKNVPFTIGHYSACGYLHQPCFAAHVLVPHTCKSFDARVEFSARISFRAHQDKKSAKQTRSTIFFWKRQECNSARS